MPEDPGALRIGEVARRTGVAVPTLRAWERRYGLLDPDRTDGGHRLYRESDVARVRAMSELLDEGWSAAPAARRVLQEPAQVTPLRAVPGGGGSDAVSGLMGRLEAAILAFDAPSADLAVDDVLIRLEIPTALDEVILPVLRRLGDGWQEDPSVIAREHFATNTLRPRLQRLLRTGAASARQSCLAVAPEGEEHDLGLLAGSVVAAHAGWRIHYLGPRTPTAVIERSVTDLAPQVVLVGAVFRSHAQAFLADDPALGSCGVVLGGEGFVAADLERLPHAVLHQGPISRIPATLEQALTARHAG